MTRVDAGMAGTFHMDWLVPLDRTTEDDYARAVAEKAHALLASARFMDAQRAGAPVDLEVRVWVEAACGSACVSITYEPGIQKYGFHLLDETLRERLGCVVFDEVPCVDAEASLAQADAVLDAALFALVDAKDRDPAALADAVRGALGYTRVPVQEPARRPESE